MDPVEPPVLAGAFPNGLEGVLPVAFPLPPAGLFAATVLASPAVGGASVSPLMGFAWN